MKSKPKKKELPKEAIIKGRGTYIGAVANLTSETAINICKRLSNQPDSRCASDDEVRICWLLGEVNRLTDLCKENGINPEDEHLQIIRSMYNE